MSRATIHMRPSLDSNSIIIIQNRRNKVCDITLSSGLVTWNGDHSPILSNSTNIIPTILFHTCRGPGIFSNPKSAQKSLILQSKNSLCVWSTLPAFLHLTVFEVTHKSNFPACNCWTAQRWSCLAFAVSNTLHGWTVCMTKNHHNNLPCETADFHTKTNRENHMR